MPIAMSTPKMMSRPSRRNWASHGGSAPTSAKPRRASGSAVSTRPPTTGPTNVREPPTSTKAMRLTLVSKVPCRVFHVLMKCALIAPTTPASTALVVNARTLWYVGFTPMAAAASSSSRSATSARPVRVRSSRATKSIETRSSGTASHMYWSWRENGCGMPKIPIAPPVTSRFRATTPQDLHEGDGGQRQEDAAQSEGGHADDEAEDARDHRRHRHLDAAPAPRGRGRAAGMEDLGGQDRGDVPAQRVEPRARDRELPRHERQVEREGEDGGEHHRDEQEIVGREERGHGR